MAENGEMDQLNKDSMNKSFSSPVLKKLYVINRLFLKSVSTEKRHRFVCLAKSILAFDCYSSLDKITCPTLVLGAKKTWFWVWMALGSWQMGFQTLLIMNLTNWGMQLILKADDSTKFY